jgi:hypothetical protein
MHEGCELMMQMLREADLAVWKMTITASPACLQR